MTGKEIIEKLEELDLSVEDFSELEFNIPSDFVFSQEIQDNDNKRAELDRQMKEHPAYSKSWKEKQEDASYIELSNAYYSLPWAYDLKRNEYLESLGIGPVENFEHYGGEDMGSTYYDIMFFPKHNVYLKVEGWYQSYHGVDYEGWSSVTEVKPIQKTVTVFE